MLLKVGQLAKRTGVTVRALHHYEEMGLLSPVRRTEAGYRLYGYDEVQRLQHIVSLQQLGFSLKEIKGCLDEPAYSLERVISMHRALVEEDIRNRQQLLERLKALESHLRNQQQPSIDSLMQTLALTTMFEKYYTPEQLETLKARREAMGEEGMQQAHQGWTTLLDAFREAHASGADPGSETVQSLLQQMDEMIQAFTGGDPGIAQSLGNMYEKEGAQAASKGMMDPELSAFIAAARAQAQK